MSEISGQGSPSSSRRVRFLDESDSNLFNDPLLKDYENLSIEELRNDLRKLEKERDEKKLKYENLKKSHSLRNVIDKENTNDSITMNQTEHMVQEMLQDTKEREYEEILNAYRLTGKTIFPVKESHIGLRFETFYKAKYHEPYYIILNQDQEDEHEQSSVFRHTLPHFIPINDLEATYLNKDISKFASAVDDYLQAFVTRREEFKTLLENGGTIDLKANNAYSAIEFSIPLDDGEYVEVNLTYDDLKSSIPTKAMVYLVKPDGDKKRQKLRRREKEFLQKNLMDAFTQVFREI